MFICSLLIVTSISIPAEFNKEYESRYAHSYQQQTILIRMPDHQPFYQKIITEFQQVSGNPGEWTDYLISPSQYQELQELDINYTLLSNDIIQDQLSVQQSYHTLEEMKTILEDIADTYPDITRLFSLGKTYENRNVWCLEINDQPGVNDQDPGVLFTGVHHAREWPTMEICLHIAQNLTQHYDTEPEIFNLVNTRNIWIIPCVNPDGYYFSHDHTIQHEWRKNRRYFPEYETYGVDINRNYDGSINGNPDGMWGSLGGSVSHNPLYELYCGPYPSSEDETRILKDFIKDYDVSAAITYHTYGELVMWPWGYSTTENTPDDAYISEIGREIASRISTQDKTATYDPIQSAELYPTTGDFIDWAYSYSHYILGKPLFAYTVEACTEFHPSAELLDQVCSENYDGALYLLKEAENISKVSARVIPPILQITSKQDGDFTLSWSEQNQLAQTLYYQIDELTNLTQFTDTAESTNNDWAFNGFQRSDQRGADGTRSYTAEIQDNSVASMTTTEPLPVSWNTTLSFWTWYEIEEHADKAFVEVSEDNRKYDVIDSYTGSSSGWKYKTYELSEYSGKSVFIRFRYTTDANDQLEGFFIDDISPVPKFQTINTISNEIAENSLDVTNKNDGKYYYRIRGYNQAYGWGDYSPLTKVLVGMHENTPPTQLSISGETNGKINTIYSYEIQAVDPENDDIYYMISWDDADTTDWLGPYASGETIQVEHEWTEKGSYTIKVKAKDAKGLESDWEEIEVSMPYQHVHNISWIRILEFLNQLFHQFIPPGLE